MTLAIILLWVILIFSLVGFLCDSCAAAITWVLAVLILCSVVGYKKDMENTQRDLELQLISAQSVNTLYKAMVLDKVIVSEEK